MDVQRLLEKKRAVGTNLPERFNEVFHVCNGSVSTALQEPVLCLQQFGYVRRLWQRVRPRLRLVLSLQVHGEMRKVRCGVRQGVFYLLWL
jgi:hypothetical protein